MFRITGVSEIRRSMAAFGFLCALTLTVTALPAGAETAAKPDAGLTARLPDQITAHYAVHQGRTHLGAIEKTLNRDGDVYRVSSDARPNPLIKLVAGGQAHEESVFIMTEDGLRSVFYSENRSGKPMRRVDFNWNTRELTFDRGGEITTEQAPDVETVDASSLPFYMMLKPLADLAGKTIAVVTGKRVGQYTFEQPTRENIETDSGPLATWRIENTRVGSEDRRLTIWVDPARRNLPVKIVQKRGKRVTTLTLSSIDGL